MKQKALIIEDELHNFRLLKGMIEKYRPEWEIIGPLESVKKAVQWFRENTDPDIIFMDIQLVDGVCFSIFENISIDSPIIFTTAFDEYALQAFEVNSIDYILKPVKEAKLTEAINKYERLQGKTENPTLNYKEILDAITQGQKKYRTRFLVSGGSSLFKVETNDIAYFYTESRITYAVTFKGEYRSIDLTLDKLEEQLDPVLFFRASRSSIINSDAILKVESYFGGKLFVKLLPELKFEVTVSRLKASEFKNWFAGN